MGNSTEKFFKEKKEWSKIKDNILACYLKPYFTKLQYTKKGIVYIDGFAGKGKFDDGTLGSPLIVFNIVKENLPDLDIDYYFIEKKYSSDLELNTCEIKGCKVISGGYEDYIVPLIKRNSGKNVFVYIDPFGIKNIDFSYLKELNSSMLYSAEFLMNLNSFGFIREGCRLLKYEIFDIDYDEEFEEFMDESLDFKKVNSIEHMNEIAGGSYWQDIIKLHQSKKITGYQAEKMFVDEYCKRIKQVGKFKYVINIPIRIKPGTPPKYRMVFATNHIDGVILMNDNMCCRFEEILKIQNDGIMSLFQENSENEVITDELIESNILSLLSRESIDYYDFIIKYINKYGILKTSIINSILKELEKNNEIIIERFPPLTTKGKKSKFIKPLKGNSVKIKLYGDNNGQ